MASTASSTRAGADGDAAQARAVAFMLRPETHGGCPVEHIETHISHVFLAGDAAYKMKKAVRFEFVDFSSLDRRRLACEAEIAVNARTAPDLYRRVLAINETGGRLTLGSPTRPVEYLVEMARFSQSDLFDRLAAAGALPDNRIREVADRIAALHLSARRIGPSALAEDFETTATQLSERLCAAGAERNCGAPVARWQRALAEALPRSAPGLRARARHGAVRHGHGDLHLRNICLFRGEVRLFDAIEFEPKFSHIDVLYDLAFTLMDLIHRGLPGSAVLLLGRYLAATRDHGGLRHLGLFVSVRAAVRALVRLLDPDTRRTSEAEDYLRLAAATLEEAPRPRLIAIGGRSGTGKSVLAQALAPAVAPVPGVVVIRSDEVRKFLMGATPEMRLPATAYSQALNERVYGRLLGDARRALCAGASVILDAAFLKDRQRADAEALAARMGVPFRGLWLSAPTDLLARRLAGRGRDASDADVEVMLQQPDPREVGPWHRLDAGQAAATLLGEAMAAVARSE